MILVLSQSNTGDVSRRDFEEELVAALIMEDGIEVSLVGDISDLTPHSTDVLCIEGVRGNMLFVSWHDKETALNYLGKLSVVGQTTENANGVDNVLPQLLKAGHYDPMLRRISCMNLIDFDAPQRARQHILSVIKDAQQQTVSIEANDNPEVAGHNPHLPQEQASPAKPMPKRSLQLDNSDDLDLLLDEFDAANL